MSALHRFSGPIQFDDVDEKPEVHVTDAVDNEPPHEPEEQPLGKPAERRRGGLYMYYAHACGVIPCTVFTTTILIAASCEYIPCAYPNICCLRNLEDGNVLTWPAVWIQQYTSHAAYQSLAVFLSGYVAFIALGMITLLFALWFVFCSSRPHVPLD